MLKLARKLLQGIARALARYANSIERLLDQEDSSAKRSISDYSDERPPAHWLAKVRQGAPHLLDNRFGDDAQTGAYSSETKNTPVTSPMVSSDMSEKPPLHWVESVRRGALHLLDEQFFDKKNISKYFAAHDRKLPQSPGDHFINEDNSDYKETTAKQTCTIKTKPESDLELSDGKLFDRTSENTWSGSLNDFGVNDHNAETQRDKTRKRHSLGQIKEYGYRKAGKPFNGDAFISVPEKKATTNKTELKKTSQTRPSARYAKPNSAILSGDRQSESLRLNVTSPNASTQSKKYQQQYNTSHEQITIANRIRIKQDLHDKRKTSHQHPEIIADPHDFANKHTITTFGFNETAASDSDKTIHASLSHKSREQLNFNRQSVVRRSLKTDGTTATDISSESNQRRYTTSISKTAKPIEPDLPRWPGLPGEKERRLRDDPWPELPREKISESDKAIQPMVNFAQLQEALKRNHQNELEQRGISWNG